MDGIESEWITENELLSPGGASEKAQRISQERGRKLSPEELNIIRMDELDRVMVSNNFTCIFHYHTICLCSYMFMVVCLCSDHFNFDKPD